MFALQWGESNKEINISIYSSSTIKSTRKYTQLISIQTIIISILKKKFSDKLTIVKLKKRARVHERMKLQGFFSSTNSKIHLLLRVQALLPTLNWSSQLNQRDQLKWESIPYKSESNEIMELTTKHRK